MSSHERRITTQKDYDKAWDDLDNRGGMSADEIRRALNMPQFESDIDTAKEVIAPKPRLHRPGRVMGTKAVLSTGEHPAWQAVHGAQYGEEEGVGYPDGKPHYSQPVQDVLEVWGDPRQQAVSQSGSAKVREEMGWPLKDKTHQ